MIICNSCVVSNSPCSGIHGSSRGEIYAIDYWQTPTVVYFSLQVGFVETTFISGGERRRTAIGMELVAGPKIVFLDEPTTSLDSAMANNLLKILRE